MGMVSSDVVLTAHHVTRHNTPIHNILSTASQLSISQKALGTLPEDGSVMPKHVGAYLLTYLLHGAESFLRSWPVFAASQEIPRIFMEPESSLPHPQVPATRPYPEPTPSNPHDSLQHPEDPS